MKRTLLLLFAVLLQQFGAWGQSDFYSTYRIDEYIEKLELLRSVEHIDTVCKTEISLWREHLRDLSVDLAITKKERRNFVKYFKAEVGNDDLVHKNIKKFTRRRNALTVGTMMLIAGSVALVLDDPSDPYGYVGSGAFYDECYCCNSQTRNNTYHRFLVQAIEDFHADYVNFNTYY